ncbi:MAG: CoA transferase [Chloroflexi bacterium]|nr:CoA transferase [Chloroflexota bacterium]
MTAHLLAGVRVVDLTWALSGPFCTLLLAGLGADVIKIENPAGPDSSRTNAPFLGRDGLSVLQRHEDDMSLGHIVRSRGKRAVTLNLKHPQGREVFADLVRDAHVVVENFSRGTLDRLGVGYAWGAGINPAIVYCSISGFGADGPPGGGKAMDVVIQALSGLMLASGNADDPPIRNGVPLGDLTAPLFAAIGILAALRQAEQTGVGQQVDVSMLGALTSLVGAEPFDAMARCGVPVRTGPKMTRLVPFGIFQTADGFVTLTAPTDRQFADIVGVMGQPGLLTDERFRTRDRRVANAQALEEMVEAWTRSHTTAEVVTLLDAVGVPAAEVRDPREAVHDERVLRRGEIVPLRHPTYRPALAATEGSAAGRSADAAAPGEPAGDAEVYGTGLPIRFSAAEAGYARPAPWVGEHNDEVYGGLLGYTPERLARLRADGVI